MHVPASVGPTESGDAGVPSGTIELFVDRSRGQTGVIARSILNGVILHLNEERTGVEMPLTLTSARSWGTSSS